MQTLRLHRAFSPDNGCGKTGTKGVYFSGGEQQRIFHCLRISKKRTDYSFRRGDHFIRCIE